jgi:hypothetical protein
MEQHPPYEVMQGYAEALQDCLEADLPQRDYQELRGSFFLTATRYGWKIFPRTIKFVESVRFTMNRLLGIKNTPNMMMELKFQIKQCKKHQTKGDELEDMHNFVAAKLQSLKMDCKKTGGELDDEQNQCIKDAELLNRTRYLVIGPSKKDKGKANKRVEEANLLGLAVMSIGKLERCCKKVLDVILFINKVLGMIICEIGETLQGFENLTELEKEAPKSSADFFESMRFGITMLAEGLSVFRESKAEFNATLVTIGQRELPGPSTVKVMEWDLAFKEHVEKAKLCRRDSA